MGMTIEEAIHDTKVMKEYLEHRSEPRSEGLGVLIDIAYKYQKIQEIVRWNNAPSPYYKPDGQLFREICEVLEDGNGK